MRDVLYDPAFEGFGRLIFPVDLGLEETLTLNDVGKQRPKDKHCGNVHMVS